MTEPPDPDGPPNPDAPDLDLDVPVPGSPAETSQTARDAEPDPEADDAAADDSPEPPD